MRIVYLHQYFVTPRMAGGVRSYEMARRLVSQGHEVHMVTSDQQASTGSLWRETEEAGIRVHWTPVAYDNEMDYRARLRAFVTFALRAARRAAGLRADVVFATSTPLTIAIPAVYAARRAGCPMVFEVRDLWPAVPIAIGALRNPVTISLARRLERFAYGNAARIVALAPGMRDEIVATGYPAEQAHVIPNGCDLELFSDPEAGEKLRSRETWLGNRPLLVFCGSFGLVNGMDYLVQLTSAMAKIDPEVCVVGIGGGRAFQRTVDLARQEGVLDRNLYLLGKRSRIEAAEWIQAADMTLALFSGPEIVWRDAVQNKFFDSLAAGKPVANNFAGWQSKIAVEAGAGLIISPTDVEEAGRDVVRALRDRAWLARAGQAAKDLGRSRFDRDSLALQLSKVLEDALAGAQRARA